MKNVLVSFAMGSFLFAASAQAASQALSVDDETKVLDSYASEKAGDYQEAIKKMTAVLANDRDNYIVNLRLAWLFSVAKKYKNAAEHYERAAAAVPTSVEPHLALSLLQLNLGAYAEAAKAAKEALNRDPKNYYGMVRLVSAHIQQKDFAGALPRAQAAAKIYPADPLVLEQEGFILMQLGKTAEAQKTLHRLLLVSPANAYARTTLGMAAAH